MARLFGEDAKNSRFAGLRKGLPIRSAFHFGGESLACMMLFLVIHIANNAWQIIPRKCQPAVAFLPIKTALRLRQMIDKMRGCAFFQCFVSTVYHEVHLIL